MKRLYRNTLTTITALLLLSGTSLASADIYIITNKDNPVTTLTLKEVRKVFLGRLHLFPGTEHEPVAIDLPPSNDVYRAFYEKMVGISMPKLKRYRAYYLFSGKGKIPAEAPNENAMIEVIKGSTYAIGYIKNIDQEKLGDVKILYQEHTN